MPKACRARGLTPIRNLPGPTLILQVLSGTLSDEGPTNRVTVEVFDDRLDEGFEFEVDGIDALDAFNHPYAYAASRGVPALAAEAQAA